MAQNAYTFRYRVRNWLTYNQALIARGGLTFWIDEAALTRWRNTQARLGAGAPRIYSDTAIHCAVVVQSVYRLSLRAAQGSVASVMSLVSLELPVPNYSTICRRQGALTVPNFSSSNTRPRPIVIDATGFRVYGAGEWQVHKHRGSQRRRWCKLHPGVDDQTKEIVAVEMTASHVHVSQMLPSLLKQIHGKVGQGSGDWAYDTKAGYQSIAQRRAKATIPLGVTRGRGSVKTSLRSWTPGMPLFVRFIRQAGMPGAWTVGEPDRAWQRMRYFDLQASSVQIDEPGGLKIRRLKD